jgi:hypothetical protein
VATETQRTEIAELQNFNRSYFLAVNMPFIYSNKGSYVWLPNRYPMSCFASQIGSTVSYWFQWRQLAAT